jgi:hypothetical protein
MNINITTNPQSQENLDNEVRELVERETEIRIGREGNLEREGELEAELEGDIEGSLEGEAQAEEELDGDDEIEDLLLDSLISNCNFSDGSNSNSNTKFLSNFNFKKSFFDTNFPNYPSNRGGHAMTIDEENSKIYIFGGWNGAEDLDDFWMFDILKDEWKLITKSTARQKGPTARSCHRMVFDNHKRKIYIYGRMKEAKEIKNNKLYEYDVDKDIWTVHELLKKYDRISNKIMDGGPGQVYDHQMCIDSENQKLFIFGGAICFLEKNDNPGILIFYYFNDLLFN